MQFYPPFSSFFSTFGVKAANGINKIFKFSPHKVSFLKPRELECVIFFSKIFGVQIKKWQKKKYPAKENRNIRYLCKTEQQNRTKAYAGESEEDNVPHTRGILSYRTNRNGLLQIRRVID